MPGKARASRKLLAAMRFSGRAARANPWTSKRAEREIAQPQIGEAALLPRAEERPVQRQPHDIVAFLDRDSDPFAEIAAVDVGSAAKRTAIFGLRSVEPEGERDCIPEQKIDLAAPQCGPRRLVGRIGANLGLGKQSFKIRLVAGNGDEGTRFSLRAVR